MAVSDYCCDILINGINVFVVPRDVELLCLKWESEQQHFKAFPRKDLDGEITFFFQENYLEDVTLVHNSTTVVTKKIPCYALYGVLSLGTTSMLLYVTQRECAANMRLFASHEIFAVKEFGCMRLPSQTVVPSINNGSKNKGNVDEDIHLLLTNEIPENTIVEYWEIIEKFCAQSQHHSGGAYFFYSPTINLAWDPSEITERHMEFVYNSVGLESLSNSNKFTDSVLKHVNKSSSQLVFQWNIPLLYAFGSIEASTLCGICSYVPAFIRGCVAPSYLPTEGIHMLLINRLSYRAAGTRYNRRGLDSAGSGITANFSISTLWVFSGDIEKREEGTSFSVKREKRMAAFQIIRGSIPRRWWQPANLTFKPKIIISSVEESVDEFRSHTLALKNVLRGILYLHCFDVTSFSGLELPLSKAFEIAVKKYNEGDSNSQNSFHVFYTKYDVKKRIEKLILYEDIQKEVKFYLEEGNNGLAETMDFSRWSGDVVTEEREAFREGEDVWPDVWRQVHQQQYYVRVNCLDCLDRTNIVQSMIVSEVLPRMIQYVREDSSTTNVKNNNSNNNGMGDISTKDTEYVDKYNVLYAAKQLWAQQGISLSQLYAGSDPHFLKFLLKGRMGMRDLCWEGCLALRRWLQQNFYDGEKQDAISLLTGQYDPLLRNSEVKGLSSKIENPFARRLSRLNKMMGISLFVAVMAAGVNLTLMLLFVESRMRKFFLSCQLFWVIYLGCLIFYIMKHGNIYTNDPLFN